MKYISIALILAGCGRPEPELLVFSAASAEEAVRAVGDAFEEEWGVRVVVNGGGSTRLRSQILRGARADVYVAAGPVRLAGMQKVVAVNRMVAIVPVKSGREEWRTADRVAMADPELAPAGVYAARILKREGIDPERVYGGNVRAVLAYVELGLVGAGLVYRSDVTPRVRVVHSFPEAVEYEAVSLNDGELSREFLLFLAGRRDCFRRAGFE